MLKEKFKKVTVVAGLSLTLLLAACGGDGNNGNNGANNDANTNNNAGGSASSFSEDVKYEITGIEPGAGVFKKAEEAIEEYGLDGWDVIESSSGAMAVSLGEAIKKEEPIVVTGWTPHWKFAKYDLKYLEDPKKVFGEEESIHTFSRKGFKDEKPNAAKLLEQFNWTTDDMEEVMADIEDGKSPEEAAAAWVEANEDKVSAWTEGVEDGDGESVDLVYVLWDSEIASTNVVGKVLEDKGFDVKITELDNAIMWQAIATDEADAMVAAWLPATHGDLHEQYEDDIEELGVNLNGAKIGLVVPSYVDIDSIEDLQAK